MRGRVGVDTGVASFVFATRCGVEWRGMSTPIQGAELSPEDPKFYAPPRWRSGAVAAPPIQPSLGESEVPSQVAADSTPTKYEMRFVAKKQSSAKRKRKGCRLRLMPRRGSNLPNNGASWRAGLNDTRAE
jgi:hypothetical protein